MVLMEAKRKNTQKHELPSRSPELAVTKTQLSLWRERRMRKWRFRVMFTVVFFMCEPQLD